MVVPLLDYSVSSKAHKVVMIRSNPIFSDPRVYKEIRSLSITKCYDVLVLAWDRSVKYAAAERIDGATIKRFRLRAPLSNLFLMGYLPIFWVWVLLQLFANRPTIVHSFDVDTIIPAYIYRKLTKDTKVIFDLCDRFSDSLLFSRSIIRPLRKLVGFLEDMSACKADVLIVVSQRQQMALKRAKHRKAFIVMNCPEETIFNTTRKKSGLFRVVHAGSLRRDYGILELAEALERVNNIEAIFAGRIIDQTIVDRISRSSKMHFIGELRYPEALRLVSTADAIPILLDPKRPTCKEVLPNRLFEAMMFGIPVVVNDDLETSAELVSATGCGLVAKFDAISIRDAIVLLKENPAVRAEMGRRGREAFVCKYNWNKMGKLLLDAYERLVSSGSF